MYVIGLGLALLVPTLLSPSTAGLASDHPPTLPSKQGLASDHLPPDIDWWLWTGDEIRVMWKCFCPNVMRALVAHWMSKMENLTGLLTDKQQGGCSQALDNALWMLLVLKTKKQGKHLLMATATKVPIFPRSSMGIRFPTEVPGKDFPTQVRGRYFPTDVRRNCILSIILRTGLTQQE